MSVFFDFIEQRLAPIAGKFASQRHVGAIRDGFIMAMPFMIVGSFLLIFAFPPFAKDTTFAFGRWWLDIASKYQNDILTPFSMSMGIMSCFITVGIAYNLAKSYKMDALSSGLLSLMTFLLVSAPMKDGQLSGDYLSGTGVFTAIIVAIYATEISRLLIKYHIGFKLPEQVPDKIRQSFNLLIPAIVMIITIYPFNLWLQYEFGMVLPQAIMAIFTPLVSASDSLSGILLVIIIAHVLWFAGIHGAAIVGGIMQPFWLYNLDINQKALAAGQAIPHTFMEPFWAFFIVIGGSGATVALVLLYLRSRSAHLRSLGKLSIIPAIFNINEPVIFGSPLVMNPIMFIPFIGAPIVNAIIAYSATQMNLVGKVVSLVPWTTPAPIGAMWASGWLVGGAVLVFGLIVVDLFIYYPFFKIYEKQLIEQENA